MAGAETKLVANLPARSVELPRFGQIVIVGMLSLLSWGAVAGGIVGLIKLLD